MHDNVQHGIEGLLRSNGTLQAKPKALSAKLRELQAEMSVLRAEKAARDGAELGRRAEDALRFQEAQDEIRRLNSELARSEVRNRKLDEQYQNATKATLALRQELDMLHQELRSANKQLHQLRHPPPKSQRATINPNPPPAPTPLSRRAQNSPAITMLNTIPTLTRPLTARAQTGPPRTTPEANYISNLSAAFRPELDRAPRGQSPRPMSSSPMHTPQHARDLTWSWPMSAGGKHPTKSRPQTAVERDIIYR